MPETEIELDPVTHITFDAVGKPGQRTFYVQGWKDEKIVTLLIEKVQIQSLALGVEQFLDELDKKFPQLPPATVDFDESKMHIQPPVDPLFRVGEFELGYDGLRDRIKLLAREILTEEMTREDARTVSFWCTRSQLRVLAHWGVELTERGRPICPQCGQPMDPEGHFCPKKNGHKH
ncbi:MAG TPA: DUF3090 domain-containing protein [Longilinea sp.]|nr:DUF3090 domain-containing protein [Longilinea sp.]